jgi:peptidoglycan hydrolase-like protein with peptidoglycan-binding domain
VLLGAATLSILGLAAGAVADTPAVVPVEAQRLKSTTGKGDAFSIRLTVGGEPYQLFLDEPARIATLAGGDEPEVGKRSHAVRPLRTFASNGTLQLELEVDGTTVQMPLGIEIDAKPAKRAPAKLRSAGRRKSDPAVGMLQESLAKLGFDPGPADGMLGRRTELAIEAFENRFGVTLGDPPTAEQLKVVRQLARMRAASSPSPASRVAAAKEPAPVPAASVAATAPSVPPASPVAEPPAEPAIPAPVPAHVHASAPALPAPEPAAPAGPEAPPALDLATYASEPYALESQRAVEAMAKRPDAAPAALERMAGVLLARGRLDEARVLADDLLRRGQGTPTLALMREAVTALTTGAVAPDGPLARTGAPWPAIAALYRGDLDRATALGQAGGGLGALPETLRQKIAFDAMERFVEARRFAPAHGMMRLIESWTAEPEAMDELAYWQGRELELKGEPDPAATLYGRLTGRPDAIGIKARYRLAGIELENADKGKASKLADELGYLAVNWVESELDPDHERRIALALRKSGRVVEAIEHLQHWEALPGADHGAVRAERLALLAGLAAATVPVSEPLRLAVLSMADRLAPDDADGRLLVGTAARQLADAGLDRRADAMLEAIEGRGDTAEQARVRLDRAAIAIEGGDPQAALRVLRTATAMVAPSSPERARWATLSARALIDAGEPAAARHLIEGERASAGDDAAKAALFEAALATGDWGWIAEQMRKTLPPDPARASREDAELRDNLLGLAAALNHAGRTAEAVALGRTWAPVLVGTPEAPLFEALTGPAPETVEDLQRAARTLLAAARGGP